MIPALALALGAPACARTVRRVEPVITTSGQLERGADGALHTQSPVMRATFGTEPHHQIELRFVYEGPSPDAQPLASGELRRQLGVKLRALDTCNVVYVMWHIEPSKGLEVSVKSNPGQSEHRQCGDRGYSFVAPAFEAPPLPPIRAGEPRRLRVELRGQWLRAWVDDRLQWEGTLPDQALRFDGPAGIRSDNSRFKVEAILGNAA